MPSYVQSKSQAFPSPASSGAIAYTSNLTRGNLLVVAVYTNNVTSNTTVALSDTLGQTWHQAGTYSTGTQPDGNHEDFSVWYVTNTAAGADTVTVTPSQTCYLTFAVHEYSGLISSGPVDATTNQFANSASVLSTGTVGVAGPNELVFAAWGLGTPTSSETLTAPFAQREDLKSVLNSTLGIFTADYVSSAAVGATLTVVPNGFASVDWASLIVSFKSPVPAASPGAGFYLPIPGAPWARLLTPPPRYFPTFPPPPVVAPPVYRPVVPFGPPGSPTWPFPPVPFARVGIRTPIPPPPPPPPPPLPGSTGKGTPYLPRTTNTTDAERVRHITDKMSVLINSLFFQGHLQLVGMSKTGQQFKIITGAFEQPRNPTVTDDSTTGAHVGSPWVNSLTAQGFMCVSAAVGAAVWKPVTS